MIWHRQSERSSARRAVRIRWKPAACLRPTFERLETRSMLSTLISVSGVGSFNSFAGVGFTQNDVGGFSATVNGTADNNPGDFNAQITWGDGKTDSATAIVSLGNGQFQVKGSHVYAAANSGYAISLQVTGQGGSDSRQSTTAVVSQMPSGIAGTQPPAATTSMAPSNVVVSVGGVGSLSAFAGVGLTENEVGTISGQLNGQADTTSTDFHAYINWGDSNQWFAADVTTSGFEVKGSHVYAQAGTFPIVVYGTGPDGTSTSRETTTITISKMPSGIAGTPPPAPTTSMAPSNVVVNVGGVGSLSAFAGVGFTENEVGTISGQLNGQADTTSTDFHAYINWGDSDQWFAADITTSGFEIKGSHVYAQVGTYPIVVYGTGPDGTSASRETTTITIANMPSGLPGTPPPNPATSLPPSNIVVNLGGVGSLQATANTPLENALVGSVGGSLNGEDDPTAAHYQASINWGDSSDWFAGQVTAALAIQGTHNYVQPGTYFVVVVATGRDGTSTSRETTTVTVRASTSPAVVATSLTWHTPLPAAPNPATDGGVDFTYEIDNADLATPATINVYWTHGATGLATTPPVFTEPSMTAIAGSPYTVHIPAADLGTPPSGVGGADNDLNLVVYIEPANTHGILDDADFNNHVRYLDATPTVILTNSVSPQVGAGAQSMTASFQPAHGALTIDQAAAICGVDHFNWLQHYYYPNTWMVTRADTGAPVLAPVQDPFNTQLNITGSDGKTGTLGAASIGDGFGFYWNDSALGTAPANLSYVHYLTNAFTFTFFDSPRQTDGSFNVGQYLTFDTMLVGVAAPHTLVYLPDVPGISFTWRSNTTTNTGSVFYPRTPDDPTLPPITGGGDFDAQDQQVMMAGPPSYGPQAYVAGQATLPFQITFQNPASAAAPSQKVVVTQQLDANLDWSTFQFTALGFGSNAFALPSGATSYQTSLNMSYAGVTFEVDVTADFNPATGVLTATYNSLNPSTGNPPDPSAGFLPPEDGSGRGTGFVSYSISPRAGLPTGTTIESVATAAFDANAPIATDAFDDTDSTLGTNPAVEDQNTIDSGGPTSSVATLPGSELATFTVDWSGTDDAGGSGVASYTIYVSDNGGSFTPWQIGTTATSAGFIGTTGHTYAFYSVATDNVGNVQSTPVGAQATTHVTGPGPLTITGAAGDIVDITFSDATHFSVKIHGSTSNYTTASINHLTYNGPAGYSLVVFHDASANDAYTVTQGFGSTSAVTTGFEFDATSVANLYIYVSDPASTATIDVADTAGSSNFFALSAAGGYSYIANPGSGIYSELSGFGGQTVTGSGGKTYAYLYSSGGASTSLSRSAVTFSAGSLSASLGGFPQVYVVGAADGTDQTTINSSGGEFVGTPQFSYATDAAGSFLLGALYCGQLTAQSSGAADTAVLYSYAGNTFNGGVGESSLAGNTTGVTGAALGFKIEALDYLNVSVLESGMGSDTAALVAPGGSLFVSGPMASSLTAGTSTIVVNSFFENGSQQFVPVASNISVASTTGSGSEALIDDSAGQNALIVGGSTASLTAAARLLTVEGFDHVEADQQSGTSDTVQHAAAIDFTLSTVGNWTSI